ncbi:MAG: hypothetical protein LUG85_00820 [Clostridiales bacterium]|nr:hypothetical protein [Clostridiales bacterium]
MANDEEMTEQVEETVKPRDTSGKREVAEVKTKGFSISEILLVAILLAAGAVLKFFVGSVINIGGMKPNFIIAMYCLAILLIRPKLYQSAIIGLLAGAICQAFPGTPYLNFISELAGAVVMGLIIKLPLDTKKFSFKPIVGTFVSTVVSGGLYTVCLFLFTDAEKSSMAAYVPIVLCTALINTVIVQILYLPINAVYNRNRVKKEEIAEDASEKILDEAEENIPDDEENVIDNAEENIPDNAETDETEEK